ncbi:MAG: hypothetical protein H0V82_08015 [Candidatus Protochlamydia sp.]|nr:hypothetical protein [Candidatus Protochlamydia sp.]
MNYTSSISSTHTYHAKSEINFFLTEEGALNVTIDTERLHIRSVEATEEDYDCYTALFGDQDVMSKFATGQTKSREEIKDRIKNIWVKR